MKATSIFESNYAIGLAQKMADERKVMTPTAIFQRLVTFAGIGLAGALAVVVVIVLLRTDVAADSNTRTFLVLTSLVGAMVLVGTVLASLVFLWDAFINQYIQRLALLDAEARQESGIEEEDEFSVEMPVATVLTGAIAGEDAPGTPALDLTLSVKGDEYIEDGDISTELIANQLGHIKGVVPSDQWTEMGLEESLVFFSEKGRECTIGRSFDMQGQAILKVAISGLANAAVLKGKALGHLGGILSAVPETYKGDESDDSAEEWDKAAML